MLLGLNVGAVFNSSISTKKDTEEVRPLSECFELMNARITPNSDAPLFSVMAHHTRDQSSLREAD